ncbi:hypothetical protein WN944_005805 [Citrus x changshan-huyou]|uniref:Uncharacterized protein n=1 Tax=Citrus x changshan-huyou TaxID=2935761 RepID=A0AAP0MPB3_9ROSI
MRLIPSIHVVPNQLHGSLKKETLTPAHGMVSSAMKTQVVSSRLTSRVAASRVLSTLASAFSRLSILSGLIFLLTTSMPDKSVFFDFFITLRLRIARKNSIFTWYLSSNKLSGELPTSIGYLDSSKELDISMNELSGQFPTSIRNLASLEEPQLPFNRFSRELPWSIGNFSSLKILHVESCKIWCKVPPSLGELFLSSNKLSLLIKATSGAASQNFLFAGLRSCNLTEILNFLKYQHHLKLLDLSSNKIHEKVPIWLLDPTLMINHASTISNKGQMMSYGKILNILSDISLSSNIFDGEIPTSISNLRGLQILSLANNSLHGHIPSCLGKPTDLESLDLSDNYLSDKIPQQLG